MLVEIQFVQLLAQLGAVGILAYVTVWLTRTKIPDDRKERAEERVSGQAERRFEAEQREGMQRTYAEMSKQQRADYIASLQQIQTQYTVSLQFLQTKQSEETEECRKERKEQQKLAQAEREADRNARHELLATIQRMMLELKAQSAQSPDRDRPAYDDDRK